MVSLPVLLNLIDELERDGYDSVQSPYYTNGLRPHPFMHPHHHHRQQQQRRRQQQPHENNLLAYRLPLSVLCNLAQKRKETTGHAANAGIGSAPTIGKDGFQVSLDVSEFKPNELNVKVVDNNNVVIEGKHEERADEHGHISRHFVRRYVLPEGYDSEKLISQLSSDGVLTINVPKPQPLQAQSNERIVPIQQTGPAHLNVRENAQEPSNANEK